VNQAVGEKDFKTRKVACLRYFLIIVVEMAMKKVNKVFLRHFGDTEKAKLFNNESDIQCAFDHPDRIYRTTTTYADKEEE
jgi:hypothetical protein